MSADRVKAEKLEKGFLNILDQNNVRQDVAEHLVKGIIHASLRGIDSHGIRLFPHYLEGFKQGRLNKNPNYSFNQTAPATGVLDADHAPGHAAGMEAMAKSIELAKKAGLGAVAVSNSSHFGAAAYFAFKAAEEDMIGLSFTHATAHVAPYNGKRPFFGNNPFCFVAPCKDEEHFCLDMATTKVTFNKVQTYVEQKEELPTGWVLDQDGKDTTDPEDVLSLLPIGGYKGFGLSMAMEILCSLLTGMEYGKNVSAMFGNPMTEKRKLGHFFIAINISAFVDLKIFKTRLEQMINSLRAESSFNKESPIMAPGDPENFKLKKRKKYGIPVSEELIETLKQLSVQNILFEDLLYN